MLRAAVSIPVAVRISRDTGLGAGVREPGVAVKSGRRRLHNLPVGAGRRAGLHVLRFRVESPHGFSVESDPNLSLHRSRKEWCRPGLVSATPRLRTARVTRSLTLAHPARLIR